MIVISYNDKNIWKDMMMEKVAVMIIDDTPLDVDNVVEEEKEDDKNSVPKKDEAQND